MPMDTSESASIAFIHASIFHVIETRAFAKIVPTIIQRIVIFVVTFFSIRTSQNNSVHSEQFTSVICADVSDGIIAMSHGRPDCMPVPSRNIFEIFYINYCVLVLSKRNQTVRCVWRLNNCVSFHAAFHRSTSNGLFEFDRHFTTAVA